MQQDTNKVEQNAIGIVLDHIHSICKKWWQNAFIVNVSNHGSLYKQWHEIRLNADEWDTWHVIVVYDSDENIIMVIDGSVVGYMSLRRKVLFKTSLTNPKCFDDLNEFLKELL